MNGKKVERIFEDMSNNEMVNDETCPCFKEWEFNVGQGCNTPGGASKGHTGRPTGKRSC